MLWHIHRKNLNFCFHFTHSYFLTYIWLPQGSFQRFLPLCPPLLFLLAGSRGPQEPHLMPGLHSFLVTILPSAWLPGTHLTFEDSSESFMEVLHNISVERHWGPVLPDDVRNDGMQPAWRFIGYKPDAHWWVPGRAGEKSFNSHTSSLTQIFQQCIKSIVGGLVWSLQGKVSESKNCRDCQWDSPISV